MWKNVKIILTGENWKVGAQDEAYTLWKKEENGEYVLKGEFNTLTEALLGMKRWALRFYLQRCGEIFKTSNPEELQAKLKIFERWWKVGNSGAATILKAVSKVESIPLPEEKKNGNKRRHKKVC